MFSQQGCDEYPSAALSGLGFPQSLSIDVLGHGCRFPYSYLVLNVPTEIKLEVMNITDVLWRRKSKYNTSPPLNAPELGNVQIKGMSQCSIFITLGAYWVCSCLVGHGRHYEDNIFRLVSREHKTPFSCVCLKSSHIKSVSLN